jgi:hypothetical protein
LHGWVEHLEQQIWHYTEDQDSDKQWCPGEPFELIDVMECMTVVTVTITGELWFWFTERNALEEPQQVRSR